MCVSELNYTITKHKMMKTFKNYARRWWFEDCFQETYERCLAKGTPEGVNDFTFFINMFRWRAQYYTGAKNKRHQGDVSFVEFDENMDSNMYYTPDYVDEHPLSKIDLKPDTMTEDECTVIDLAYTGYKDTEIGKSMGLSHQRIGQLRHRAINKIREANYDVIHA